MHDLMVHSYGHKLLAVYYNRSVLQVEYIQANYMELTLV